MCRSHSRVIRVILLLLVFASLLSCVSCSKIPKSSRKEQKTVLTIDGFSVPYEQVRYFVCNYMESASAGDDAFWTAETAAEMQEAIYEKAFDQLKDLYAILSLCREYGVDQNGSSITEMTELCMDGYIAEYEDEESYVADLLANYLNHSVYSFLTSVDLCKEELYNTLCREGVIESDDAVIASYIRGDDFIRVKQILITPDAEKSDEEARALAESLHDRAVAGEDFDTLVKKYGDDLFMFNNTDGYYICRGIWYEEFENTAFDLAIGEISDVVETPAGYSILLRCPKENRYLEKNMEDLCDDYREAQFTLMLEERAASLNVVRQENFAECSLFDFMGLTEKSASAS